MDGREGEAIPQGAVVVGIGNSDRDAECLTWAGDSAQRSGSPLHVLHAHDLNAELTASLAQVVDEMNAALDRRSFRDRIADAAATLPGLDPEHRRIMTGSDRA